MAIKDDKFGRRDFIKKTAVASAALAIGGKITTKAASKNVKLVQISGSQVASNTHAAIKKALEPLGGMKAFVKKGQVVMLKPNMGFPTAPDRHATTNPEVVAAVAKEVIACGAKKVLIVDNPMRRPEACLKENGIQEATKGLDVNILFPTSDRMYTEIKIPKGKSMRRVHVYKEALKVDVHIAMPVGKSHNAAGFSGGMKGMMGIVLDRESFHSKYDLNQAIADLNTILKPQLVVLDGLKVMATDGPAGPGELVTTNTIVVGTDPVAVDAAGVRLAPLYGRKIKARQIKHLKLAQEMGLGKLKLADDQVVTLSI
jgi:uncharacterized protein (DUF362 family)